MGERDVSKHFDRDCTELQSRIRRSFQTVIINSGTFKTERDVKFDSPTWISLLLIVFIFYLVVDAVLVQVVSVNVKSYVSCLL